MKLFKTTSLALLLAVAGATPLLAQGETDALVQEFTGVMAARTRTPVQAIADYSKVLASLLPDMSSDDLGKQYAAKQTWEKIALHAARPGAAIERDAASMAMVSHLGAQTAKTTRLHLIDTLRYTGRAEAVPALAALINDQDELIGQRAINALANLPVPEAGLALRDALVKTTTVPMHIKLINALGYRNDTTSTNLLIALAQEENETLAAAAIAALENTGNPAAVKALQTMRPTVAPGLRPAVTEALFSLADTLLKQNKKADAATIYGSFTAPSEPVGVRLGALRGLALAAHPRFAPLLLEVLASDDAMLREGAASLIGIPSGEAATRALTANLAKLPRPGQVALLRGLSERNDAATRAVILSSLKAPDEDVRVAAIETLGTLGTAADVNSLARLAADSDGKTADAARASLARLRGDTVDAIIVQGLTGADSKMRTEMARALASRRSVEAVPALLKAATGPDAEVRTAALNALGNAAAAKDLPALLSVLAQQQGDDIETAEKAVISAYQRMPAEAASSAPTLTIWNAPATQTNTPLRVSLLKVLGASGDDAALTTVRAATQNADEDVQSAAVRVLSDWPKVEAAPALLDIARNSTKTSHQVLALRGYARLTGTNAFSTAQKVQMYRDALQAAQRPEEKKLMLAGLGNVTTPEALRIVEPYLDDAELREEAAVAAVNIAKGLDAGAKPAVEKVIGVSQNEKTLSDAKEVLRTLNFVARRWNIVGAFPSKEGAGFDLPYIPEGNVDVTRSYPVDGGPMVGWKQISSDQKGYIDLRIPYPNRNNVVVYASVFVKSPDARQATASLGSDDGAKLWVNGKQAIGVNEARPAQPGQDKAEVELKPGWNEILLKITQGDGDWGFYFDLLGANGQPMDDLQYSTTPDAG